MITMRTHLLSLLCLLTLGGGPAYAVGAQSGPGGDASSRKENTLAPSQWPVGAYTAYTLGLSIEKSPLSALIWRRDETTFWVSLLGDVWAAKQIGQGTSSRLEPLDAKMPTVVLENGKSIYFSGPPPSSRKRGIGGIVTSKDAFTQKAPDWVQKAFHSLEKAKFFELQESDEKSILNRDLSLTFSGPLLTLNSKQKKTCARMTYTLEGWPGAFSQKLKQGVFAISAGNLQNETSAGCTQELAIVEAGSDRAADFLALVDSNGAVEVLVAVAYMKIQLFVREGVIVDSSFKKRLEKSLS